ncbi:DUF6191 domain-containing protein [Kitasatospora sp. NPDC048286]|uniref:DUF6191 domain-containing protein n=1 Tax=unclassified Kitasatospora TaxID=2633591 RepID=UPI00371F25B8
MRDDDEDGAPPNRTGVDLAHGSAVIRLPKASCAGVRGSPGTSRPGPPGPGGAGCAAGRSSWARGRM